MSGRTVIITGGTAGIGLAAARALAGRGHRLILIGRDARKGREALASLSASPAGAHRFMAADLSLLSNVLSVVAELEASERAIDVLANNAGAWFQHRAVTSEGVERTVAINHLAYVALTLGLKRLLLAAPAARVINTGSFFYTKGRYDPANLQGERHFSTNATYAATKLYNLMFTRALARHWSRDGITINCFSPGFVATDFGRGEGGLLEPLYRFTRLFAITPEKGAETLVHLADAPVMAGQSGGYFEKGRKREVTGAAADERLCEELLRWSASMAGFEVSGLSALDCGPGGPT